MVYLLTENFPLLLVLIGILAGVVVVVTVILITILCQRKVKKMPPPPPGKFLKNSNITKLFRKYLLLDEVGSRSYR